MKILCLTQIYTTYIKEIIKDDFSAMKFLRFYVGIWKNGNNICEYELQNNMYMEYISTEEALVKIERARTLDCFWTFDEDMPGCIAAFSLFYRNIDTKNRCYRSKHCSVKGKDIPRSPFSNKKVARRLQFEEPVYYRWDDNNKNSKRKYYLPLVF